MSLQAVRHQKQRGLKLFCVMKRFTTAKMQVGSLIAEHVDPLGDETDSELTLYIATMKSRRCSDLQVVREDQTPTNSIADDPSVITTGPG